MITPDILLEKFSSFRTGDKNFCTFASVSDKDGGIKKYLGFWIEVVQKDKKPVLSLQFESLENDEPIHTMVLFGKEHLELFIEDARMCTSKELEKIYS